MERLKLRSESLKKALDKFGHTVDKFKEKESSSLEYEELRDSLIQRFEFSVDTFWKFLMQYMMDELKVIIDQSSPKKIFQKALEVKLMTGEEYKCCIAMIDDRNMTSHTYNELLAEEISKNLPNYYQVLDTITKRLHVMR